MARKKFKRILSWGYKGIEVWNFLSAIGLTSMLRGIFSHIVGGWTWYDQLFLFGGAFLLILGILIFVFRNRGRFDITTKAVNKSQNKSSGIDDMILGARAHKCSRCGWGFRVTGWDRLATCPNCDNVDEILR